MDQEVKIETKEESFRGEVVHLILSHSYTVFLLAVILGVILDVFIPINIFNNYVYQYVGFAMIVLGSILIYWAQSTTRSTKKEEVQKQDMKVREFARGPYKYSRNPTYIGITIMTLGLGFLINSVFSVVLVLIASLITKFIFIKKEEILLEQKYGEDYCNYKKKVCTWI